MMLLKGNLPPKMYSYGNILARNYLSYIFEFQIVYFAFSLILGDPFMVSPSLLKNKDGRPFSKKDFSWGNKILRRKFVGGLFYMGGLIVTGKEFKKNTFPSNQNTVNLKIFPDHGGIFT